MKSEFRHSLRLWESFKDNLVALVRLGDIISICDLDISPGANFQQLKNEYFETADVILLLFSPDFFADEDCYTLIKRAKAKHESGEALVFRIELRWVYDADISDAQLPRLPENRPITEMRNRQKAFVEVVKRLHKAIIQEEDQS